MAGRAETEAASVVGLLIRQLQPPRSAVDAMIAEVKRHQLADPRSVLHWMRTFAALEMEFQPTDVVSEV